MSHPPEKGEWREHGAHDPETVFVYAGTRPGRRGSGAKFTIRTARLTLPRPETLVMPNAALFQRAWVHHSCRRDLLVFGTLYMR